MIFDPVLTRVRIVSNIIERGGKMKKKVLIAMPYIAGLLYLIYCMANINYWVKSHLGFGFYALIPILIAVVLSIAFMIVRIFTKKKFDFYLPFLFFVTICLDNIGLSNNPLK